jgi:hypothetical protein
MKFRVIFTGFLVGLSLTIFAGSLPVVEIDAVSVNSQNQPQIFWTPSSSPDVHGYRVFEEQQGVPLSNFVIDTIFGRDSNTYTVKRQADTNFRYRIDVFDQDFNHSHVTSDWKRVFLCRIQQRGCQRIIDISWTDPTRSIDSITHFEIWISKNTGDSLAKTVDNPLHRSTFIEVYDTLRNYKFFVRAVDSNRKIFANSSADSGTLITAPTPKFAILETASVMDNQSVEIRCSVDIETPWRSLITYADEDFLNVISKNDFLKNNPILLPRRINAFYRFEIIDSCGDVSNVSNVARPILLGAEFDSTNITVVELIFSELIGSFDENNVRYDVIQTIDGKDTVKTGLLPNQSYQFTISRPWMILNLNYVVVTYEIGENTSELASSNVVNVIFRDEFPVYFATGFVPRGNSPIYRPIYIPDENDQMQFRIFNTYGQVVFSMNHSDFLDESKGWDGTFNNNGNDVQQGGYVYTFELIRKGRTMRKRGVVTLIR